MPKEGELAKHLWLVGLVWVIPAMAVAGYFIGREYKSGLLGALIGVIVGTLLFWLDLLRAAGLLYPGKRREEAS